MKTILVILSCMLLLTSCDVLRSSSNTPNIPTNSPIPRETLIPTETTTSTTIASPTTIQEPTVTLKKVNTTTPTPTKPIFPSPAPNSSVTQICVEIIDKPLPDDNLNGILALGNGILNEAPYLLDLNNGNKIKYSYTTENPWIWLDSAATSPGGKWLAYIEWFRDANISRLHLISSDLKEQPYLDLPTGWGRIIYWLDDQQILISTNQKLPEGIFPTGKMMILNPFLREWKILSPNLPFQISTDPSPWNNTPDNPIVIYNPSLTRAVYLALSGFYLINAKSLDVITHIDTSAYGSQPQWSPQGNNFAMVIDHSDYPEQKPEIYQFTEDGQSEPITNIANAFDDHSESIETFNWSPDGNKIVFSYFVRDYQDEHIAVVNVKTGQTVDYCIPTIGALPPVWSPDSKKIAFASGRSTNVEHVWSTVVLDIEKEYAVQVANTMLPLGWMASP